MRPSPRGGLDVVPLGATSPTETPPDKERRAAPARLGLAVGLGAVAGTVSALAILLTFWATGAFKGSTIIQKEQSPPASDLRAGGTVVDVARRARPAIVSVRLGGSSVSPEGSGSGVIIRSDGYVITNHHVVRGASSVTIELSSGRSYPARVIGSDAETDVAVVKIEAGDLPVATLGTARNLEVGQLAIAIGSPLGLAGGPSVTVGVISALGRSVPVDGGQTLLDMIQTDAPVAPGSSGGALLDERGAVVGITTAAAVTEAGALDFGFATAIDIARREADQLVATGRVVHPLIGLEGRSLDSDAAARLHVNGGALVTNVQPGTPADQSGIRTGDVVVAFDNEPVGSMDEFTVSLRSRSPGDRVELDVARGGNRLKVTVVLGARS